VVAAARSWIGTPFHHRARLKGVGVDCSGLIVGVCRELGLVAADFDTEPYTTTPDARMLREGCARELTPIDRGAMQPGDVVLLAITKDEQHLGILGDYRYGGLSIIHAANNVAPPRVIETRLMFSRSLRFCAAYSLPRIA